MKYGPENWKWKHSDMQASKTFQQIGVYKNVGLLTSLSKVFMDHFLHMLLGKWRLWLMVGEELFGLINVPICTVNLQGEFVVVNISQTDLSIDQVHREANEHNPA